jgi:hypothetical protein
MARQEIIYFGVRQSLHDQGRIRVVNPVWQVRDAATDMVRADSIPSTLREGPCSCLQKQNGSNEHVKNPRAEESMNFANASTRIRLRIVFGFYTRSSSCHPEGTPSIHGFPMMFYT